MKKILISVVSLIVIGLLIAFYICSDAKVCSANDSDMGSRNTDSISKEAFIEAAVIKSFPGLKTDTSIASINLSEVRSGGPGKDGIPAINNPKFVSIEEASNQSVRDDTYGVLVHLDDEIRFYPYNILVWHEIVNDSIGDNYFTVTFCPLCGTAIVFNREFSGKIHEFGVSGLLWESNLLMYDKDTESLWSQAAGKAVVGEYTDTELGLLQLQLVTFENMKEHYPTAVVMDENTGYDRAYTADPYGDYEENNKIYFPVSVDNSEFFSKELMFSVKIDDKVVAIPLKDITDDLGVYTLGDNTLKILKEGFEINAYVNDVLTPSYYEMWFSWATQHEKDGLVWRVDK